MHDQDHNKSASPSHTPFPPGGAGSSGGRDERSSPVRRDEMAQTERPRGWFNFGRALEILLCFGYVSRVGWNGQGQYLELQRPDLNSKMTRPYIFIHTVDGGRVPWIASQSDLLSDDWIELREHRAMVPADSLREVGIGRVLEDRKF